jgi:NSS family neurotransmitter:Na+ symporter
MNHKKHALFTSRWGFILSAVGSAVGMANVWGFPAKMGANGGGAFLVAYLFFIALFSIVALSTETAIGRYARTGTLGSYKKAWASRSPKLAKAGGFVGWLPLIGAMCIAVGYAVIVAYVLKALFQSLNGELMQTSLSSQAWFESFSS